MAIKAYDHGDDYQRNEVYDYFELIPTILLRCGVLIIAHCEFPSQHITDWLRGEVRFLPHLSPANG